MGRRNKIALTILIKFQKIKEIIPLNKIACLVTSRKKKMVGSVHKKLFPKSLRRYLALLQNMPSNANQKLVNVIVGLYANYSLIYYG
jgi:hypothetical protein